MRGLRLAMMVPILLSPSMAALAAQTKVAVFEFELIDTSLEGAMNGPRADEQRRLARLADELRGRLAASGRDAPDDLSPGAPGARAGHLQATGRRHPVLATPAPPDPTPPPTVYNT